MNLTKVTLSQILLCASRMLLEEADLFSEIDSRFGDGDHGVSIKKIALLIQTNLDNWGEESIKQFFDRLGLAVMGMSGGSAGPLWGTLLGGFALPLGEETVEIAPETLKAMLASALEEMESITTARVGDKTMMDTLIPAVRAAQEAGDSIPEILQAAAEAAEQGAKDTEQYISKFGRAKSYKEKTIGTPDAGAVSLHVFFKGLAVGIRQVTPTSPTSPEGENHENEKVY
jgi:phosphoenolpyruvate---glycerone phosphotransferase subunit DhaL